MLASTTAAGLPFVPSHPKADSATTTTTTRREENSSSVAPSTQIVPTLAYSSSLPSTTVQLQRRPRPPHLSSSASFHSIRPNAAIPPRTHPNATNVAGSAGSGTRGAVRAPTARQEPLSFPMQVVFGIWDWAWRQWYAFIATWGISVMEPWERVFTLTLFASLLAIFGLALVKLPTYTQYACKRLGYYVFGNARRIPLDPSSSHFANNETLQTISAGLVAKVPSAQEATATATGAGAGVSEMGLNLDLCQHILASLKANASATAGETRDALSGIVGAGAGAGAGANWAKAS